MVDMLILRHYVRCEASLPTVIWAIAMRRVALLSAVALRSRIERRSLPLAQVDANRLSTRARFDQSVASVLAGQHAAIRV